MNKKRGFIHTSGVEVGKAVSFAPGPSIQSEADLARKWAVKRMAVFGFQLLYGYFPKSARTALPKCHDRKDAKLKLWDGPFLDRSANIGTNFPCFPILFPLRP
jgi:hypothetical protein